MKNPPRMNASRQPASRPASWAIILAFTAIYLSWGTTYFAIREGVKTLPPALFGGVRIGLAGVLVLAYLALRGESIRVGVRDVFRISVGGMLLFVGGNGLITVAEKTVPSGVASVLVATTPLWIGLIEMLWPHGERLSPRGWLGLFTGLGGVLLLLAPKLQHPSAFLQDLGPMLVLGSALAWSFGSVWLRYRRPRGSHLMSAAYQMVLGGGCLIVLGLILGESHELTPEHLTSHAIFAFFYLLVVGSLTGFIAYNWLLGHVPAALVGTYAYVNPFVAILVGWLLGGEELTGWIIGGMLVILAGVALIRSGGLHHRQREVPRERELERVRLIPCPAASART